MRSTLLAAASLAALALFWTGSASAQSDPIKGGKPYLSALLSGSSRIDGPAPPNSNPLDAQETGLGLALAIGLRWLPLRAELEYNFFSSSSFLISDILWVRTLTANAIFDWQVIESVGIYVAAGLGSAQVSLSGSNEASGNSYVGQVQAGIAFGNPDKFQLLLGFRRFATGHLGLTDTQGRPFDSDKVRMTMAQIGIRSNF